MNELQPIAEGEVSGFWLNDGTMYLDRSRKVFFLCDNDRFEEVRSQVIEIGKQLGQLAMYFEVRDFDGARVLDVE